MALLREDVWPALCAIAHSSPHMRALSGACQVRHPLKTDSNSTSQKRRICGSSSSAQCCACGQTGP